MRPPAFRNEELQDNAFLTGRQRWQCQAEVVQMLRDAGYKGALLDGTGYGAQDPAHPYELNRVRVSGGEDIYTFAGSIYGADSDTISCE